MPAGVITSQASSRSASNASAVQKLLTWREQFPAPRSSIATSAAGRYRNGRSLAATAPGSANRPPAALAIVTPACLGR